MDEIYTARKLEMALKLLLRSFLSCLLITSKLVRGSFLLPCSL